MKAEDYIKSQAQSNKWLKELTPDETNHLIEMHKEYARIQVEKDREEINKKLSDALQDIADNIRNTPINLD